MRTDQFRVALLATAAACLAAPTCGRAQEGATVQEVVVTAQKREERLQDVPVAITAVAPSRIENSGITNITKLNGFVPNLQIHNEPGLSTGAAISIRGGVTINPALSFEPTVGIYVDGAYVGKTQGGVFDVVDLERVEVLRGPQGTLYGRNTLAGAINLVSRKPTGQFDGDLRLSGGNYGFKGVRARVDLPAIGDLKVKVALNRVNRDGFVKVVANPYPGVLAAGAPQVSEANNLDSTSARVAAEYTPRADLTFDYSYDFSLTKQRPQNSSLKSLAPGGIFDPASPAYIGAPVNGVYLGFPLDLYVAKSRPDTVSLDANTFENVRLDAHTLTGAWKASPDLTLKSITAYRQARLGDSLDLDGSPLPVAHSERLSTYSSFSEELQAVGAAGAFTYVGGLYYFHDKGFTYNPQGYFGRSVVFDSRFGFSTDAYAVYGQFDWRPDIFDGQLKLSAGGRYTHEKKTADRFDAQVGGPVLVPQGTTGTVAFDSFTPMVTVSYQPSRSLNFYVRYAEGFKSGGFNGEASTVAETLTPYRAETVDSIEIGAKTTLLDRRLQINAALFHDKHDDMQLSVFTAQNAASSAIRNAGSAIIQGIELEIVARPVDWLNVQASWGYLDTKYDEFIDAGVNAAHNRAFPYAARNTASITVDATFAHTDYGIWTGSLDTRYTSRFFGFPFPLQSNLPGDPGSFTEQNAYNTEVRGYALLDGRLSLREIPLRSGLKGELALWARNILDKKYENVGLDFGAGFGGLRTAFYGDPRTFGADFTVSW